MTRTTFARLLALSLLLGSYKGYIALFDSGCDTPREIYPYAVTSLPQADQQALQERICVENDEALCQLLEDYLS